MKRMINIKLSAILLMLVLISTLSTLAQTTRMIVTLSDKSFPERFDFGESLRISSLAFLVNGKTMGYVSSQLNSPDNTVLSIIVEGLTDSVVNPSIKINYIHHIWIPINISIESSKSYPLESVTLNSTGVADEKTYTDFSGLPMVVTWRFNYKIEISPFKPVIPAYDEQCFNETTDLHLEQGNALFYDNPELQYQWQYGFETEQWADNWEFLTFKDNIAYSLSSRCTGDNWYFSCSNVTSAIYSTDYNFMNSSYDLYNDLTESNEYQIAGLLLNGILERQNSFLTEAEKTFLSSYFYESVMNQEFWPAPYIRQSVVTKWLDLGTTSDINGSIALVPKTIYSCCS